VFSLELKFLFEHGLFLNLLDDLPSAVSPANSARRTRSGTRPCGRNRMMKISARPNTSSR